MIEEIPFELKQLSSYPQDEWIGKTVLHPCFQQGNNAAWRRSDMPEKFQLPYYKEAYDLLFDIGIVTSFEPDPNFFDLGVWRVYFMGYNGGMLFYGADNLWVPQSGLTSKDDESC